MNTTQFLSLLQGVKKSGNGWTGRCPAHDDGKASLSISTGDDGRTLLHCHAGCTPEAICAKLDLKLADLFPPKNSNNGSGKHISATYDYLDASGKLVFQVVRFEPKDFRQRQPDGKGGWTWNTKGTEKVLFRLPEVLKAKAGGKPVFICEGEKDCDAMKQRGFTATCNPGGAGKWQDSYSETLRGCDCIIIADKDEPGRAHAALVADKLHGVAKSVRVLDLPDANGQPVKDAADYFNAGGDTGQIFELVDLTPEWTPAKPNSSRLTLRTPDEILAMEFDDSDKILGDRLLAKGQPLVIAGAGGTGKSRFWLQGIAATVTSRKFLAFDTGGSSMRWLILQTENSNRRLQQDLGAIKKWLGEDWPRFAAQVTLHTLENEDDGFVNLDSVENQLAIQAAIESAKPDGIVVDPLNDFAAGDLNKDADIKLTLQTLSRLCRRGCPDRAMVVLHHSLTGKAGVQRASGFDRASFARNSKTLFAWTRGQINLAPIDPDSNDRLAVVCGKCSNGPEFQPFAIRLNAEMIYECDPSVDVNAWADDLTGRRTEQDLSPARVKEIVSELCRGGGAPKKPAIVKALREKTGCAVSGAYKAVDRAERAKAIHYTKATRTYAAN